MGEGERMTMDAAARRSCRYPDCQHQGCEQTPATCPHVKRDVLSRLAALPLPPTFSELLEISEGRTVGWGHPLPPIRTR